MRSLIAALRLFFISLTLSTVLYAQGVKTVSIAADSYVWDGSQATYNYGHSTTLNLKTSTSGLNRWIFLRFTLPTEPNLSAATLWIYGGFSTTGDDPMVSVYSSDDGWTEGTQNGAPQTGTITWNNPPSPIGTTSEGGETINTGQSWRSITLNTAWVQSHLGANISMAIKAASTTGSPATFVSKDDTVNTTEHPHLDLTVTAPTAPSITANSPSSTEVDLTLTQGSTPGTSYTIYRSPNNNFTPGDGSSTTLTTSWTSSTYPDTGRREGTPYYYIAVSNSDGGSSPNSSQATATTHMALPAGVAILVDPCFMNSGTCSAVSPYTSTAIMAAVYDLQNDLKNVYGVPSTLYTGSDETNAGYTDWDTEPMIVITGAGGSLHYNSGLTAWEGHEVKLVNGYHDPTSPQRVVLQGTDTRGTIYAIYEFSKSILKVPPLYYWTGWQPPSPAPSTIDIVANTIYDYTAGPATKYRGTYPVDSELLTPWGLEPPSSSHYNAANYNAYFATLLRLKLDLVDINSITDLPYVDGAPSYTSTNDQNAITCAKHGLMVSFPHTNPLGASYGDWNNFWTWHGPAGHAAPSVATAGDLADLDTFWSHYVTVAHNLNTLYGLEVLETITFRGSTDAPWYAVQTDGIHLQIGGDVPGTDISRAGVVAQEMKAQLNDLTNTLASFTPPITAPPPVRLMFYDETQDFLGYQLAQKQGLTSQADGFSSTTFNPPTTADDPYLIWTFSNQQRDHVPGPDARLFHASAYNTSSQQVGYYMNVEYESTGAHISSMEGPYKTEANYRYIMNQANGKFGFSMLNLGNFREFTVEASAAAELLWVGPTTYVNTDSFLTNKFAPLYFSSGNASTIDSLYSTYYNTVFKQKAPDFPLSGGTQLFPTQYIFQDLRYYLSSVLLLKNLANQCYNVSGPKCLGVSSTSPFFDSSGAYEPEEVTLPVNGGCQSGTPSTACAYYNINADYIDSTDPNDAVKALMVATGALGTTFNNLYNVNTPNCTTVNGTLTTAQSYYFVDSLCSNIKLQSDLNFFLYHLAKADTEVGTQTNATILAVLNVAQTYLNNISNDLASRYTNQSGTTIDGDFTNWYSPYTAVTEFSIPTLQTDLCTAITTYGGTCP